MTSTETSSLQSIVDVERYPILDNQSEKYNQLLSLTRDKYQKDGIVILPGFLTQGAITESVAEVLKAKGEEWFTQSSHNVFLDSGDSKFPPDHIRNRQLPTSVASLAYDKLSSQGPLLSLYNSEPFRLFLAQVLELDHFYRLEDPLGAASINIFPPGTAHNWHFDEVGCLDYLIFNIYKTKSPHTVRILCDDHDPEACCWRTVQEHPADQEKGQ